MSADFVRSLAIQQRKRLVASLMDHFEKEIAPSLAANVRSQLTSDFRNKVLASVGAYHDMTLDMLKASVSDGVVVNEEAMSLLQSIHQGQQSLLRREA